jgi:hypothetical protein
MERSERHIVSGVFCTLDGKAHPVINLSVGGFFVATPSPPPQGQVLAAELHLPGRSLAAVLVQVAWVNDVKKPKRERFPSGFGGQFVRISIADQLAIIDALRFHRALATV